MSVDLTQHGFGIIREPGLQFTEDVGVGQANLLTCGPIYSPVSSFEAMKRTRVSAEGVFTVNAFGIGDG